MNRAKNAVVMIVSLLLIAGIALAGEQKASIEKGKALFNDPKLGTTGKSCNDCHKGGKGAEKAVGKKELGQIVNGCITQGLHGKALDENSLEMQSLLLYINSLGAAEPQKKPPVGC